MPLQYALSSELDTNIHSNPGWLLGKAGHTWSLMCKKDMHFCFAESCGAG